MQSFLGVVVFIILSVPLVSTAATLYIDPGTATVYRGDAITTSVRIMPDQAAGECINAADVVVTYPEFIQPVDVSIGRSIFSVWVEDPKINKEERTITFAGGIPNGYCGRVQGDPGLTNVIADIVFRSPGLQIGAVDNDGVAVISFTDATNVYLNDGLGTKASLVTLPSTITMDKAAGSGIVDDWREDVRNDDLPPESFSITLERDTLAFGGKYFIVFTTTDKQTGLSHYEVMEESVEDLGSFAWGRSDAPWVRAVSPYVLEDQSLNSTIRVRAFDKAGNEYVATLIPDESLQTMSRNELYLYLVTGAGALIFLLIAALLFVLVRRRRSSVIGSTIDDPVEEIKVTTEDV
jgi:hypothetical protein